LSKGEGALGPLPAGVKGTARRLDFKQIKSDGAERVRENTVRQRRAGGQQADALARGKQLRVQLEMKVKRISSGSTFWGGNHAECLAGLALNPYMPAIYFSCSCFEMMNFLRERKGSGRKTPWFNAYCEVLINVFHAFFFSMKNAL